MAYDFTNAVQSATQEQAGLANNNNAQGYQYKLVYPQVGQLQLRLLFNPKSNNIIRKIVRHEINDQKIPCYCGFGMPRSECPICSTLNKVKEVTGQVPQGSWAKTRGIFYAQYISSTYPIADVKQGDVILTMVPKTVYDQMMAWIPQNAQNLDKVFSYNEAMPIQISRDAEHKYVMQPVAFNTFKSVNIGDTPEAKAQEEQGFNDLMSKLPNLNEVFVPLSITDEIKQSANLAVEELTNKFLRSSTGVYDPQQNQGVYGSFQGGGLTSQSVQTVVATTGTSPINPTTVVTATGQAPQGATTKQCFGSYNTWAAQNHPLLGMCKDCAQLATCKGFSSSSTVTMTPVFEVDDGNIPF